jgi:hypothetical protein
VADEDDGEFHGPGYNGCIDSAVDGRLERVAG